MLPPPPGPVEWLRFERSYRCALLMSVLLAYAGEQHAGAQWMAYALALHEERPLELA